MKASELRGITEKVAGPLGRAVQEEVQFIDFLAPDTVLRYSVCGLATAALGRYLAEQHGVATTRVIIDLPELSPSLQTRHVILRHDASLTIDPTYGQFYEYAGVSAIDTVEHPEIADMYPAEKIAVIEDEKSDEFIASFALGAYAAAEALFGRSLRTLEELAKVYKNIWQPERCRRFSSPPDAMVERILIKLSEV